MSLLFELVSPLLRQVSLQLPWHFMNVGPVFWCDAFRIKTHRTQEESRAHIFGVLGCNVYVQVLLLSLSVSQFCRSSFHRNKSDTRSNQRKGKEAECGGTVLPHSMFKGTQAYPHPCWQNPSSCTRTSCTQGLPHLNLPNALHTTWRMDGSNAWLSSDHALYCWDVARMQKISWHWQ